MRAPHLLRRSNGAAVSKRVITPTSPGTLRSAWPSWRSEAGSETGRARSGGAARRGAASAARSRERVHAQRCDRWRRARASFGADHREHVDPAWAQDDRPHLASDGREAGPAAGEANAGEIGIWWGRGLS